MAVLNMTRNEFLKNINGATYIQEVTVGDGLESDVYALPVREIVDIAWNIYEGTGNVQFTIQDPNTAVNFYNATAGEVVNKASTAFKVVSTSGQVKATITVKTATT